MSSTSETIVAAAPVAEPQRKRTRSSLNQGHLRRLTKAENVINAAQNDAYTAALAAREISANYVGELASEVSAARDKAGLVLQQPLII